MAIANFISTEGRTRRTRAKRVCRAAEGLRPDSSRDKWCCEERLLPSDLLHPVSLRCSWQSSPHSGECRGGESVTDDDGERSEPSALLTEGEQSSRGCRLADHPTHNTPPAGCLETSCGWGHISSPPSPIDKARLSRSRCLYHTARGWGPGHVLFIVVEVDFLD